MKEQVRIIKVPANFKQEWQMLLQICNLLGAKGKRKLGKTITKDWFYYIVISIKEIP